MRAKGRESQGSVRHYLTSVGSARGNVSQESSRNRFIDWCWAIVVSEK